MFESQLKISLNEPFPKNSSLADIMEKAPKMFVMPLVEIAPHVGGQFAVFDLNTKAQKMH